MVSAHVSPHVSSMHISSAHVTETFAHSTATSAATNAALVGTRSHTVAPSECLASDPNCGNGNPGGGLFIGAAVFLMLGAVAWVVSK